MVLDQDTRIGPSTLSLFAAILKLASTPLPIKYPLTIRHPLYNGGIRIGSLNDRIR